jgi:hypothetical protein
MSYRPFKNGVLACAPATKIANVPEGLGEISANPVQETLAGIAKLPDAGKETLAEGGEENFSKISNFSPGPCETHVFAKEAEREALLAEIVPPSLQQLAKEHGGYNKIPREAWAEYDCRMEVWKAETRSAKFSRSPYLKLREEARRRMNEQG